MSSSGGPLPVKRVCLKKEDLETISKEDLIKQWLLQDQYIDSIEAKPADTENSELVSLRESEEKLKQQQLEATRRENILVMRLTTKEQEMQEYASQIQELKQGQVPTVGQLRVALLDPAVNLVFEQMRKEVEALKARLQETQNELSAWKFTPDSNTGKRLMAKCRLLYQENEELGKMISSGRLAKLEGDLALQRNFSEEMKKSQTELDEFLQEIDEDVEGMQSTIIYLQQQLREAKEQLSKLQADHEQALQGKEMTVTNNGNHTPVYELKQAELPDSPTLPAPDSPFQDTPSRETPLLERVEDIPAAQSPVLASFRILERSPEVVMDPLREGHDSLDPLSRSLERGPVICPSPGGDVSPVLLEASTGKGGTKSPVVIQAPLLTTLENGGLQQGVICYATQLLSSTDSPELPQAPAQRTAEALGLEGRNRTPSPPPPLPPPPEAEEELVLMERTEEQAMNLVTNHSELAAAPLDLAKRVFLSESPERLPDEKDAVSYSLDHGPLWKEGPREEGSPSTPPQSPDPLPAAVSVMSSRLKRTAQEDDPSGSPKRLKTLEEKYPVANNQILSLDIDAETEVQVAQTLAGWAAASKERTQLRLERPNGEVPPPPEQEEA